MIPSVVASESGGWLNRAHVEPGRGCVCGVVGLICLSSTWLRGSQKVSWLAEVAWDGPPQTVRARYAKTRHLPLYQLPSSSGPVESAVNLPGPPGKPEYFLMTDSGLVP